MIRRRQILGLSAAFVCSLFMTVGCGQKAAETGVTSEGTAAQSAASGEPIVLGYSSWAGWWPWAIAEEEGLFEKNGVNVKLVWFDGYLESIQSLASGQLDANSQTLNDTLAFAGQATNGMVAVLVNDNSAGNDKVIVAEGINSIKELRGKTVALEEGVVGDFLLSLALEKEGLTRKDVTIKSLETGAAATAFAAGQADAFAGWVPFWETALSRPNSKELTSSKDFPGAIPDLLVVSQKLVDERPEQVQALVNTWFDVLKFIQENPERANEIMAKRASISQKEFERYLAGTRFFTIEDNLGAFQSGGDMKSMPFAAEKMTGFMTEVGLITDKPDLSKLFNDQFVKAYSESK